MSYEENTKIQYLKPLKQNLTDNMRKRNISDSVPWQSPYTHKKSKMQRDNKKKRHQTFRLHNECGLMTVICFIYAFYPTDGQLFV